MKEIDYVKIYAKSMKNDNTFFKQQKVLIESQMKASSSLFKSKIKNKRQAREYLKKVGILKSNQIDFHI
jgi:hypothetical protein